MAFPWLFESNFEAGTNAEWDSETDTGSQLDFPHYTTLAQYPWVGAAPFRGAYAMRASLVGGTADAFVTEGDLNIALAANRFVSFAIYFSPTFTGTADDTFNILELQETGNAAMITFGARIVAATNVINLGIGKAAPTTFGDPIERGVWYTIEIDATLDDGASDDGTIDIYVTKADDKSAALVYATQVASLDQTAVTHGVLGIQDHLATTTGVILLDSFVFDDARIYAPRRRYVDEVLMTKSGHLFVGPGIVNNTSLLSGAGTDCVLSVYDTDKADTNDASNILVELKNTANNEIVDPAGMPVRVRRGAYVTLSGTNPRGLLQLGTAAKSDAAVRRHGLQG